MLKTKVWFSKICSSLAPPIEASSHQQKLPKQHWITNIDSIGSLDELQCKTLLFLGVEKFFIALFILETLETKYDEFFVLHFVGVCWPWNFKG